MLGGMQSKPGLFPALVCSFVLIVPALDAADRGAGIGPDFKGPLGLQLYSLRDQFATDVVGTLQKVRDFGFRNVELAGTYNLTPAEFKQQLDAHGLKPIAGHFPYERLRDDIESVAREAKALGLEYVGCAWIPHQRPFHEKAARDASAVFNRAGEALSKHGLKFMYHQHGYEFQSHGDGTLLDLMMRETRPEFVRWQMDVVWIIYPGVDPVELLEKHGARWELMHLKDLRKGVPTGDLSGNADVRFNVPLGTGQADMPAILRAAQKAGVKWYFIEDESPRVLEQIPVSLRYLEQVRF
jgi:sugar phosphate isomerase/epimerase